MGEGTALFPDVFRVDQLESDDLFKQDEDERFELRRRPEEIDRQQALAPPDDDTAAPPPQVTPRNSVYTDYYAVGQIRGNGQSSRS